MVDNRSQPIVVVSGLPRSGTSLMMKMLDAAGLPILSDGTRRADADNPGGYYELEEVKNIKEGHPAWLEQAPGKAVKVVAPLLKYLPDGYHYRIIVMRRAIKEILASQRRMLERSGKDPNVIDDDELGELFERQLEAVLAWLAQQYNMEHIEINYADLVADPGPSIRAIEELLGLDLSHQKMAEVVDVKLYRQRAAD